VLAYAVVDSSVQYTERQTMYVDGKLLGAVPRLAICQNIGEIQLLVLHCDEEWNVLGVSGGQNELEKAKSHIERAYAGIGTKWIDTNVSVEEATAYRREQAGDDVCSFCGRTCYEVRQLVAGENGRICDICVREFGGHHVKAKTDT
jgi:hypothetical protein